MLRFLQKRSAHVNQFCRLHTESSEPLTFYYKFPYAKLNSQNFVHFNVSLVFRIFFLCFVHLRDLNSCICIFKMLFELIPLCSSCKRKAKESRDFLSTIFLSLINKVIKLAQNLIELMFLPFDRIFTFTTFYPHILQSLNNHTKFLW